MSDEIMKEEDENTLMPFQKMVRPLVRGIYQIQKVRVAIGLRIVANWKVKNGQAPSKDEKELDKKALDIIAKYRIEYNRITDIVALDSEGDAIARVKLPTKKRLEKIEGRELISDYAILALCHGYFELVIQEKQQFKNLEHTLDGIPIWDQFLSKVDGIGPAIAGVIISEINISKCTYVSSLWKYLGLDVVEADNRGRGRYKEHLVPKTYVNKDGEVVNTVGLSHNGWAKSKIVFLGGGSLLRAKNTYYSPIYGDYKNRLKNHPKHIEKSDGWQHSMARRYMVKRFLADLYVVWRTIEGLPVYPSYEVAKLGINHRKVA